MEYIELTLNSQKVKGIKGQTILEVARDNGIDIPHLCYHPKISKTGACRLCLVKANGMYKASCTEPAAEGMDVIYEDNDLAEVRKGILEMLLAEGDHNCLTCDWNGNCELQNYCYQYNVEPPVKDLPKNKREIDLTSSQGLIRDENKCILCGRCVKACAEIQVNRVWDFAGRGSHAHLTSDMHTKIGDSSCVQCGTCVQLCPTGALSFQTVLGRGMNWELKKESSICIYCGVGCKIDFYTNKEGKLVRAMGNDEGPNKGHLCVKGRFGFDFVQNNKRLTTPLIKKNGKFEKATWGEALDLVASKLGTIKKENGPDALMAFASAKCSNEENYLVQKLMRSVIGTNNVDHCARLCHSSTVAGLATVFGSGAMTNPFEDIPFTDTFFIIGSNTTENHPVAGSMIKRAVINDGKKLIVADPRKIELAKYADIYLPINPGTNIAILNGLMHVIIKENLHDKEFIKNRTEGFEELAKVVEKYTPEYTAKICGLDDPSFIVEAARMLAKAKPAAMYYSMGVTQFQSGVNGVKSCANIQMILGNLGVKGGGVNPLRGQSNVQGACDMGALPNVYSGYQAVNVEDNKAKFMKMWECKVNLSAKPGLTIVECLNNAIAGNIKGLYVMGENPMMSDPNQHHVQEALEALDFLVVQDIVMTETAELADVVLPAYAFLEKEGTVTNTERRVQPLHRVVTPPGEAKEDWWITTEIAKRLGANWSYQSAREIFEEIRATTPSYAGFTYERIEREDLHWPCLNVDHPGTPILHKEKFTRGLGIITPVEYTVPAEEVDAEYPVVFTTGRMLEHFHTGTMSRNSKILDQIVPEAFVEINPADAKKLGVSDNEIVKVSTRRGSIDIKAKLSEMPKDNVVFIPFHFVEAAANKLTIDALDPTCKMPELKVCACKVEKKRA